MKTALATALAFPLLALASCTHASRFWTPDGEEGYVINCGGRFNDMASCYNLAHDQCRGPYRIVNGADDQRLANNVNGQPMVVNHRELTVVCGR